MTNPTPKRFRPRFSIRTLAIIVTLVCCYAACWGPTNRRGLDDVFIIFGEDIDSWPIGRANAPLVVSLDKVRGYHMQRHYYFWFFGYVAKLPYERELKAPQL